MALKLVQDIALSKNMSDVNADHDQLKFID
jgi:hypothetical protein